MTTLLLLLFLDAAGGADSLNRQAWFKPQALVSFTSWEKNMWFRVLDVEGHSALIEVEIKSPSTGCKVPVDCLPAYRIERWRLPNLILEGAVEKPVILGELVAARVAGAETFLFYQNQLVIADKALKILERVSYPEGLGGRLDHGSPVIGVAGGGDYVFVNSHLWDRQRGHWQTDQRWGLISPRLVMGAHRVMALGSLQSGKVWLIPYQAPKRAHRVQAREFQRLSLSPDERRLLIEERNGLHRLINVEGRNEVQRWSQRSQYQRISWRHNRSLAITRDDTWTLHQIEPHRVIARGSQEKDTFAIVAEQLPVGIFFDPKRSMAKMIHLNDGRTLGQQALPELSQSYAWLGQDVPMAYSQRPLTLLLGSGSSKRGVQQFRPYTLEMGKVPRTVHDETKEIN